MVGLNSVFFVFCFHDIAEFKTIYYIFKKEISNAEVIRIDLKKKFI